ncbi:MAG: carboxypeptidase regulatory-like domain-containing protein [Gemmatimonadaceae bacterium]
MSEGRFRWPATWIVALFGCCAQLAGAQADAKLTGIVQDANTSRPLIGAAVTLGIAPNARTTRTDENGEFQIQRLERGSYQLLVRSLGYQAYARSVTITGEDRITAPLNRIAALDTVRVRAAKQAIYGVVATAAEMKPVDNASVQVYGTSVGEVTTDSTGHFFYALRTPGVYMVRSKAPGYASQTVSVTIGGDEGVEVALLLDSISEVGRNELEAAYADFRTRLSRRGIGSVIIPRTELMSHGDGTFTSSLRNRFAAKGLRLSNEACVFMDGTPRPGYWPEDLDLAGVEMLEAYPAQSERSGILALQWRNGWACGDTGMPRAVGANGGTTNGRQRAADLVKWVVVWTKH